MDWEFDKFLSTGPTDEYRRTHALLGLAWEPS